MEYFFDNSHSRLSIFNPRSTLASPPPAAVCLVFGHASQSWMFRHREPAETVSYEEGTKGKGGLAWSEVHSSPLRWWPYGSDIAVNEEVVSGTAWTLCTVIF